MVLKFYEENKVMVLDYKIDEKIISVKAKHVLFSNPLLDFIDFYKDEVPNNVLEAASKLEYSNHISVHLTIDKKLFDDNWINIHSPDLKMARISDFTNFSNHVVFGSATEKLKNFKTKVSNIENHLLTLSQSLYSSGSSMIQTRKNTFEEIRKIKQTFTPYEKFLYNKLILTSNIIWILFIPL